MDANADGATPSVSTPSTDDSSKFLSLPPELVARVTSFVNSEALIPVRLTCKTLEDITFNRFAKENFEHIYCWVHTIDDLVRLKNILQQSPRLGNRIRQLTLTTDVLRGRPLDTVNFVQKERDAEYAARALSVRCLYGVKRCYIGIISMLRTLQDIHCLSQDIFVTADLADQRFWSLGSTHWYHPQQATLFSVAMSRLKIHSLTFHRLKDILQNSPTLRTRVRRVTLTVNPYEDQPLSALHVVRANNEEADDWGRYYMSYNLHKDNHLGTGHVLMHRVLRDLKDLPQDVSVSVDLTNHNHACCSYEFRRRTFQSVLFSITLSKTAINSLTIDDTSLKDVEDILAHNRDDFMASMSTITSLKCISDFWLPASTPVKAVLVDILRSITKLRHLTFEINRPSNTEVYVGRCFDMLQMPQEVWLAANFSNLVSLTLRHVVIDMTQHELEHILAQCRSSLTHLTLSRVAFLAGDEEWKRVSEMLLAMSGLIFVELQMVHPREDPVGFWGADVETLSGGNPPGIRLEGRNNVVRGLQELSDLGPAFFEQLR